MENITRDELYAAFKIHPSQRIAAQLTMTSYSLTLPETIKNKASELFNIAGTKTGKILKLDDGDNIWIKTRSGWLSLNIAYVRIAKGNKENEFVVHGFAAEGFISQKTATGAVKKFLKNLKTVSEKGEEIKSEEVLPLSKVDLD